MDNRIIYYFIFMVNIPSENFRIISIYSIFLICYASKKKLLNYLNHYLTLLLCPEIP